jgi:hypothetical protein
MDQLYELFITRLRNIPTKFSRFLADQINWDNRLISITGARGAGKTTLILQHIKKKYKVPDKIVLYADVNNPFFLEKTLFDLAEMFYKKGGQILFLDEIHKYQGWSEEIKEIYDTYSDLKLVITGSSILEIEKGKADLSRRLVNYFLTGLSFREYINLASKLDFHHYSLEQILNDHMKISYSISESVRPLEYFSDYLKFGYYPYFLEGEKEYADKLLNTVNLVLEVDLPAITGIDYHSVYKMKSLLAVISSSVPFKPNTQKLSNLIGLSRPTLIKNFTLLKSAQLINMLQSSTKGIQKLAKPEKIYLNNPNLIRALAPDNFDIGNLRETFFLNQLVKNHKVEKPAKGDFLINGKYTFEVGGKDKQFKQIKEVQDSWLVSDNIETGYDKRIPLWLFGFLY